MASIEPNHPDNPTVWRVKWRDNGNHPSERNAEKPVAVQRITVSDLCWLYLKSKAEDPKPPSERSLKEYRQPTST